MKPLILQPTETAQWQALVKEAEQHSHLTLSEDLESYLTFLLIRFTGKPEMAKSVLALDFLHSLEQAGSKKLAALRDVGDQSLLVAGFFPGRAQKKHVRISYFVKLGQNAYSSLADLSKQNIGKLYTELCEGFVGLMDLLQMIREQADATVALTPLQAEELWSDLASPHALAVLQRHTQQNACLFSAKYQRFQ
jgi:hypothetical protein